MQRAIRKSLGETGGERRSAVWVGLDGVTAEPVQRLTGCGVEELAALHSIRGGRAATPGRAVEVGVVWRLRRDCGDERTGVTGSKAGADLLTGRRGDAAFDDLAAGSLVGSAQEPTIAVADSLERGITQVYRLTRWR